MEDNTNKDYRWKPGQSGNPNGRPKGSANRITAELREAFAMLLENNLAEYEIWLARVAETNPEKALDLAIKISERFIPALARTEVTGKDGADLFKNVKFKFGPDGENSDDNETPETEA